MVLDLLNNDHVTESKENILFFQQSMMESPEVDETDDAVPLGDVQESGESIVTEHAMGDAAAQLRTVEIAPEKMDIDSVKKEVVTEASSNKTVDVKKELVKVDNIDVKKEKTYKSGGSNDKDKMTEVITETVVVAEQKGAAVIKLETEATEAVKEKGSAVVKIEATEAVKEKGAAVVKIEATEAVKEKGAAVIKLEAEATEAVKEKGEVVVKLETDSTDDVVVIIDDTENTQTDKIKTESATQGKSQGTVEKQAKSQGIEEKAS